MAGIFAVGIGPGKRSMMTEEAAAVIESADHIVCYTTYAKLIREAFPKKEIHETPMRQEVERCRMAFRLAGEGGTVAVVCSGDAGVYGMAGLLYELSHAYPGIEIVVVPGVTAAISGAAVLGAPLSNDFCVISLSDLLTPWEQIEEKLRCAAKADFAVCLYNPMSKSRREHLRNACEILMEGKPKDTVCGWVRNIGRAGQEKKLLTLEELCAETVDMFTTVFVGTAKTVRIKDAMVTKRGYR